MKFDTRELRGAKREQVLAVLGDEPWLREIYASFPDTHPDSKLRANLSFRTDASGLVYVRGDVSFTPVVDCSRCALGIKWEILENIDVCYRPSEGVSLAKEQSLNREELDYYYMEGTKIDIEALLNEAVQTAVPISTVVLKEDAKTCLNCGVDTSKEQVLGSAEAKAQKGQKDEEKPNSPFAVLARLK